MQPAEPTPPNESCEPAVGRGSKGRSVLILIAHGSRNPLWRASVERLSQSLQADLGCDQVRLAYMERAQPTLLDAASDAVRSGAKQIRVLPLFLASQGHVEHTIGPQLDELRKALGPPVEVKLLPPVGQHRLFLEALSKIAAEEV